jgi:hypothetical protein
MILTRLVCAISQSRMTALANDFALVTLRGFASTLKDDSSLIAEQEVKLDNKELVRSNGVLFSEGEPALPSTALLAEQRSLVSHSGGPYSQLSQITVFRSDIEGKDSDRA